MLIESELPTTKRNAQKAHDVLPYLSSSSIQTVTVGPGVSPGQRIRMAYPVADCTASGESHPALKTMIHLCFYRQYTTLCRKMQQGFSGEKLLTGRLRVWYATRVNDRKILSAKQNIGSDDGFGRDRGCGAEGEAEALRQKDRIRTILRKVRHSRTPTVQPAYVRGISQVKTEAQNAFMGVLCLFLFCHTQLSKVYTIQKESKITGG